MPGNSRTRHCGACHRDILNAAALTPEQIERHIRDALKGEPMPCMRLVQFEDGSLMTAPSERQPGLFRRAIAALSALALAATSGLVQGCSDSAKAIVRGQVVDARGRGIAGATVRLWRPHHLGITVKTEADGRFAAEASPGNYAVAAGRDGFFVFQPTQTFVLHQGDQQLPQAIQLREAAFVTMGVIMEIPPDRLKTTTKQNSGSKSDNAVTRAQR